MCVCVCVERERERVWLCGGKERKFVGVSLCVCVCFTRGQVVVQGAESDGCDCELGDAISGLCGV